jgi:UDP-2,3-diacylglucosamine pyrophosphatase LpxH
LCKQFAGVVCGHVHVVPKFAAIMRCETGSFRSQKKEWIVHP